MKVVCPKCKAENKLPDTLDRKSAYRCYACKKRFAAISSTDFGIVGGLLWMAWGVVPALAWASALIEKDTSSFVEDMAVALLVYSLAVAIGAIVIIVNFFCLS